MKFTLKDKVKASVQRSKKAMFLRTDFNRFGEYRQVSQTLATLVKEAVRARLPDRRVKRYVTVGETIVLPGMKSASCEGPRRYYGCIPSRQSGKGAQKISIDGKAKAYGCRLTRNGAS